MNTNEELVYSSMGLDPILLLEEPPLSENYTVHIIRPGEDTGGGGDEDETKLHSERKQTIDNNKKVNRLQNKNAIEQHSNHLESTKDVKEKDNNLDVDEEKNDLIGIDNVLINEKDESNSNESNEVNEDPRRKRRRSSASS